MSPAGFRATSANRGSISASRPSRSWSSSLDRWRSPGGRFLLGWLALASWSRSGARDAGRARAGPTVGLGEDGPFSTTSSRRGSPHTCRSCRGVRGALDRGPPVRCAPLRASRAGRGGGRPGSGWGGFATGTRPGVLHDSVYGTCLDPGETILPSVQGRVRAARRSRAVSVPNGRRRPGTFDPGVYGPRRSRRSPAGARWGPTRRDFRAFLETSRDERRRRRAPRERLRGGADQITAPRLVGGVALYQVQPNPPSCLGG